jgi:hypothetical protein
MIDSYVILAPFLLLLVIGLLQFVGCNTVFGIKPTVGVAPSPITFQQPAANLEVADNNSIAAQFGFDVSTGDCIVVWLFYEAAVQSVATITDNATSNSNVYSRAASPMTGSGQLSGFRQELWYAANIDGTTTGGAHFSVTATFDGAFNATKAIVAHEYRGVSTDNPLHQTATNVGTTAGGTGDQMISTDSVQVDEGELVFGAAIFYGTSGKPGPGFGFRSTLDDNLTEDQQVAKAGSIAATFFTSPSTDWLAQLATFRAEQIPSSS